MNFPTPAGAAVRVESAVYVAGNRVIRVADMIVAWLIAIGIIVGGVLVVTHLGLNVLGMIGQGFHELERALSTPL